MIGIDYTGESRAAENPASSIKKKRENNNTAEVEMTDHIKGYPNTAST